MCLLTAVVTSQLMAKHLPSVSETQPADEVASFSALLASHAYFTSTPVTKALHTFKFGPFVPLEEDSDTSLLDVALILGKYVPQPGRRSLSGWMVTGVLSQVRAAQSRRRAAKRWRWCRGDHGGCGGR